MAFVTNETNVVKMAGYTPALVLVTGTYTNSGGGTGGVVSPGYTNSSGTLTAITNAASAGCRTMVGSPWFQPGTEDATTPKSVVAYNTTRDRDECTLTTAADSTGFYFMYCLDNGS